MNNVVRNLRKKRKKLKKKLTPKRTRSKFRNEVEAKNKEQKSYPKMSKKVYQASFNQF